MLPIAIPSVSHAVSYLYLKQGVNVEGSKDGTLDMSLCAIIDGEDLQIDFDSIDSEGIDQIIDMLTRIKESS